MRAGTGCHYLPLPSAATMAGRSLPSVTVTAAALQESPIRRLGSIGRRHPSCPTRRGQCREDCPGPSPHRPHPPAPEKRLPGSRVRRGHDPEEEKETEDGGLRPREIWEIWKTSSALGDSCSPRTRTRPKTPSPPQFLTLPSRDGRQRRRRAHSASWLSLREGARAVT